MRPPKVKKQVSPIKVVREDLVHSSDRDKALAALSMMKELEKEKRCKMTTIFKDDGKTLISATKDRLNEILTNYDKRRF